ncbi:MAG: GDSL family lipase [Fimbriimonadia bacterium]|nr:GDSL family lipase [Fimbriimonadia bacterium]
MHYMTDPLEPTPEIQDPTVPLHAYWSDSPTAWLERHRGNVDRAQRGDAQIVFLGDSITEGWMGEGRVFWDQSYVPRGAVDFGISGDKTQQLLWRIAHGTLDGMSPRLVILKIGVNNLWADVFTHGTQKVAEGIRLVVQAIQEKQPASKILLLGILPAGRFPDDPLREFIAEINAQSAQLDNGESIRYLDMGERFLMPNGEVSAEVMPDYLHLSEKGYAIWHETMEPLLQELVG